MEMLLTGLIIGAFIASGVWFAICAGNKKRLAAEKREKEELMLSVGLLLADADAIEGNFRSGALARARFTRSLGDKVNEITRALRTNMHLLDVFFVKYAEQQAEEYMRMIENPERRKGADPQPVDLSGVSFDGENDYAAAAESVTADDAPACETVAVPAAMPVSAAPVAETPAAEEADEDQDAFVIPEPRAVPAKEEAAAATESEEAVIAQEPAEDHDAFEAAKGAEAEVDDWTSQTFEDYEAGFAQFEGQDESGRETGGFIISAAAPAEEPAPQPEPEPEPEPVVETPAPEPEPAPAAIPEAPAEEEDDLLFEVAPAPAPPPPAPVTPLTPEFDPEFTETIAYDRTAAYSLAPIQAAPPPPEEAEDESTGITGDDVGDAIDNLFKLK